MFRWHSVKESDRGSGIYRRVGRGLRNVFDTTTLIPGHVAFSVSSFSSLHDKSISICILIRFLILILMLCSRSFDVILFCARALCLKSEQLVISVMSLEEIMKISPGGKKKKNEILFDSEVDARS